MGWKNFKPGRLVCPQCGYDGSSSPYKDGAFDVAPFIWLEDTTARWNIIAIGKGRVQIEDGCSLDDEYWNPRIQCVSCGGEFPLPEGMTNEFIDADQASWEE